MELYDWSDGGVLNDTDIRLFVFFAGPEIAEHLPRMQKKACRILRLPFARFFFLKKIFLGSGNHALLLGVDFIAGR
ncbi:hypothetical protein [Chryseolinea soli]|uniref:hypothetical protein n=1 Tax=Chryseolinea soli TaxID=2321403 RepID=UPI0015775768|nr:hypothetical protein [Chryseolinea soli]